MVFSSPIFLFAFLPFSLILYYISPTNLKNFILLSISLFFYAWGEVFYLAIMLISIIINYIFGILINKYQQDTRESKIFLSIGIFLNLLLLVSFKYANFITDNINLILIHFHIPPITLAPIHLPLGISFFTFQAISYIVDVYRKEVVAQRNIFNLALYISLFPQLIAGPIVRYHDVSQQIQNRTHTIEIFASGINRFIYGLAKKMLIANPLGEIADNIFVLTGNDLTMPLAWIGILSYSLQIYFDFSGYSDMAIGLGRMFGFRFLENFNYPYIATSMREFWRRWHISLSTWFKDYLYIPLGGNRVSTTRVYINLFIVFLLTGIWHGASWTFLIWGLLHGIFLASEHAGFSNYLKKLPKLMQHIYLLFIVVITWVFFRAESLSDALTYLHAMFNLQNIKTSDLQFAQIISHEGIVAFFIGILLSTPFYPFITRYIRGYIKKAPSKLILLYIPKVAIVSILFGLSILKVASSTYNPFIYFRF